MERIAYQHGENLKLLWKKSELRLLRAWLLATTKREMWLTVQKQNGDWMFKSPLQALCYPELLSG